MEHDEKKFKSNSKLGIMENNDPKLLFFSGGTALNSLCSHIKKITTNVTHILPISDNGGSTAEILRVVGGPAIGDIRSRMIRLADSSTPEARSVQTLLQHRLPMKQDEAKNEWNQIVEGTHSLWKGISEAYKETIRAFLVHFHMEILKRAHMRFEWKDGSIGNYFFSGARMFFHSLETAIFWFSRVSGIHPNTHVIPVITDYYMIGVELSDPLQPPIHGQHEISHPSDPRSSRRNLVDKDGATEPLPSPITRVFYLNQDRQETLPTVNPNVIDKINSQDTIIYSMGSLYTSVIPCLILKGIGEAIAAKKGTKILIMNGYLDRETFGMTAIDFIEAITNALNRNKKLNYPPIKYITHLIYARDTKIEVDNSKISALGIQSVEVNSIATTSEKLHYVPEDLTATIQRLCVDYKYRHVQIDIHL